MLTPGGRHAWPNNSNRWKMPEGRQVNLGGTLSSVLHVGAQ